MGSPGRGLQRARQHLDQGGLSGTVLAEKAKALPAIHHQAHPTNRHVPAKILGQVADHELMLVLGARVCPPLLFADVLVKGCHRRRRPVRSVAVRQDLGQGPDGCDPAALSAGPPPLRQEEEPVARGLIRLWQDLVKVKPSQGVQHEVKVQEPNAGVQLAVPKSRDTLLLHGAAPVHQVDPSDHRELGQEVEGRGHLWHLRPCGIVPVDPLGEHDPQPGAKEYNAVSHDRCGP
mmetsp:Transcript_10372/g.35784  ORF Transcript_10372/g.35784 Transcript_10372/m.35784 type:complete len:233 (-) Transcript_10372:736-1434(-)